MRKFGMFVLGLFAIVMAGTMVQAGMGMDDDDDNKFSLHGEVRFRGEWWSNQFDFTDTDNDSDQDDDFDLFPYRVRMAAKGDLGHDVWVKGEFQGSGVAGGRIFGETPALFGDQTETFDGNVALYQGWVKLKDVGDSVLDLTFGRQEIVFDHGLHFSNLPYYNGISHDGVMAEWDWESFGIHAFWTRNTEGNQSYILNFNDSPIKPFADVDNDVIGVHFKHTLDKDDHRYHDVAYYLFYNTMNAGGLDASHGDERGKIYTIGARWGNKLHMQSGLFWNVEAAIQSGDYQPCAAGLGNIASQLEFASSCNPNPMEPDETLDMSSFVLESKIGWLFNSGTTDQKIWVGYTMATGDDDPNDDDFEGYMPLFTDFHYRLGAADQYALSNIEAISVGYKVSFDDRHTLGGSYWMFSKAEDEDMVISPVTGVDISCNPPSGESCDDSLSQELDLFYNFNMTENFSFNTALAYVMPDDATEDHFSDFGNIDDVGDDDAFRLTLQARARF